MRACTRSSTPTGRTSWRPPSTPRTPRRRATPSRSSTTASPHRPPLSSPRPATPPAWPPRVTPRPPAVVAAPAVNHTPLPLPHFSTPKEHIMTTALAETTRTEVEDFIFYENRLLDDRKFEEWLELYREDAEYWMPAWD